ncbi:MAG: hypothetical protein ACTHOH_00335, partial [Lysobacteraceae bacterium]
NLSSTFGRGEGALPIAVPRRGPGSPRAAIGSRAGSPHPRSHAASATIAVAIASSLRDASRGCNRREACRRVVRMYPHVVPALRARRRAPALPTHRACARVSAHFLGIARLFCGADPRAGAMRAR